VSRNGLSWSGKKGERRRRARAARKRWQPNLDRLEDRRLLASALTTVNVPISAVEGEAFSGEVARFTESDGNTDATKYTAQIFWGDGHSSTGTVVPDANPKLGFDVNGTHTFKEEGPETVVVKIADSDGDSASVRTTSIVADAPLSATGVTIQANKNQAVRNVVVATFTDGNTAASTFDFSAKIDWGDGTTSNGLIVKTKSGFSVLGSHIYRAAGAFAIQTSIRDGATVGVATQFYTPVSLVSDGIVTADHTDPNLINPWGIVATTTGSPFWVSDNNSGLSTLYNATGTPQALVVSIPGPNGSPSGFQAAPTGVVANAVKTEFRLPPPPGSPAGTLGPAAAFIFATEDGTISGWNPGSSGGAGSAVLKVDNSTQVYANGGVGAVYKGLALANNGGSDFLYATNFRSGNIDVFNTSFQQVTEPTSAFHDPSIPAGFAPFGIQNINGNLYVTYALQNADMHDDVAGAGNGFVDVYSPAGVLLQKIGGTTTQPELNSPWGLAMAPSNFGKFSGDLLVGNFGDSHVSAFDPVSGDFLGQLSDAQGNPLVLLGGFQGDSTKGLWGLSFGNGGTAGATNTLYFTAGVNDEGDGLLGSISATSFSTTTASSTAGVNPVGGGHDGHASDPNEFR
jgi:uncharacterized protein (TIGR03118 family)